MKIRRVERKERPAGKPSQRKSMRQRVTGKIVHGTLREFPPRLREFGIRRFEIARRRLHRSQLFETRYRVWAQFWLKDRYRYHDVMLFASSGRWWLCYGDQSLSGGFKTRAEAIDWFVRAGR